MAIVDLTQPILDFEKKEVRTRVNPEVIQTVNAASRVVAELFGTEANNKFINMMTSEKYLTPPETLKNLIMSVLMSEEDESRKIENFKLLQQIATNDKADLGPSERERIYKKILKTDPRVIIVGRVKEYLIDAFEDTVADEKEAEKATEKIDEINKKKKAKK